ncbi:MAG: hypothetical protein HYV97_01555 [Bdellovibrio sp.]|nr:hypothetical protein [Bdellovibrio sp.]
MKLNIQLLFIGYLVLNLTASAYAQGMSKSKFTSEIESGAPFSKSKISEKEQDRSKGTIDKDSWSNYYADSCEVNYNHIQNEQELRNLNMRRCDDGTVSFLQPDSEGWFGNEGKCGQTAASNVLFMYCGLVGHPQWYSNRFLNDLTPGVRPGTLESGLNTIFDEESACPGGTWNIRIGSSYNDFLYEIENGLTPKFNHKGLITRTRSSGEKVKRSPVIALLRSPGSRTLHWVTITDILNRKNNNCQLVINHWDDQYAVPCHKFGAWSWGAYDSYAILFDPYTILTFE